MLQLAFHQKQGPKLERSHFLTCGRATLELRNIGVICGSWKVPYTRRRLMPLEAERQRIYASYACVAVAAVAAAAGAFVTVRLAEYGIGLLSSVKWKYEKASVFS